ncbi:MAG: sulfurtransferase complex subunit TusB [Promethearchaeota archaeon]
MLESKLESLIRLLDYQIEQKKQIHLIFIHDGVIGTSSKSKITPSLQKVLKLPVSLYALKSDLLARGIEAQNLQDGIKGIDYEDLVEILVSTPKIVSWM